MVITVVSTHHKVSGCMEGGRGRATHNIFHHPTLLGGGGGKNKISPVPPPPPAHPVPVELYGLVRTGRVEVGGGKVRKKRGEKDGLGWRGGGGGGGGDRGGGGGGGGGRGRVGVVLGVGGRGRIRGRV